MVSPNTSKEIVERLSAIIQGMEFPLSQFEITFLSKQLAFHLGETVFYRCDWNNCEKEAFFARKRLGNIYCQDHNNELNKQELWYAAEEDRVNGPKWAKALRRGN